LDSPVPNSHVAIGDFEPSLPPNNATFPYIEQYKRGGEDRDVDVELLKRTHRSPQPVWYSLVSNAPSVSYFLYLLIWFTDLLNICSLFNKFVSFLGQWEQNGVRSCFITF